MIDYLLHIALNNAGISLALAVLAAVIGTSLKRPVITHIIWLMVFVKLLIPPAVTMPSVHIPWMNETSFYSTDAGDQPEIINNESIATGETKFLSGASDSHIFLYWKQYLFFAWISGSVITLLWSLFQVIRFQRMLKNETVNAPAGIQSIADDAASVLGIKPAPIVHVSSGNISPMVWWTGGKVWLVIPASLVERMESSQIRMILLHEIAHISRRDHICRWVEWIAGIFFWWNPVTWWARYNLHANEELCCDEMVLSNLNVKPYLYGDTLIKAVDILMCQPGKKAAMASRFNGTDLLKRRVRFIAAGRKTRPALRWLETFVLLSAIALLPFGFIQAKIPEAGGQKESIGFVQKKLESAKEQLADELTEKEKFRLAYRQVQENMYSDPAYKKTMLDAYARSLDREYVPFFKKINMSDEKIIAFKNILISRTEEIQDVALSRYHITSREEKDEASGLLMNINYRYNKKIKDFLGEKSSREYHSYKASLSERYLLTDFFKTLPPEERISDTEADTLIKAMHEARKGVYDEMGPDISLSFSPDLTEDKFLYQMKKIRKVNDRYIEVSRNILPEKQAGLYEVFINNIYEKNESNMKIQFFLNGDD